MWNLGSSKITEIDSIGKMSSVTTSRDQENIKERLRPITRDQMTSPINELTAFRQEYKTKAEHCRDSDARRAATPPHKSAVSDSECYTSNERRREHHKSYVSERMFEPIESPEYDSGDETMNESVYQMETRERRNHSRGRDKSPRPTYLKSKLKGSHSNEPYWSDTYVTTTKRGKNKSPENVDASHRKSMSYPTYERRPEKRVYYQNGNREEIEQRGMHHHIQDGIMVNDNAEMDVEQEEYYDKQRRHRKAINSKQKSPIPRRSSMRNPAVRIQPRAAVTQNQSKGRGPQQSPVRSRSVRDGENGYSYTYVRHARSRPRTAPVVRIARSSKPPSDRYDDYTPYRTPAQTRTPSRGRNRPATRTYNKTPHRNISTKKAGVEPRGVQSERSYVSPYSQRSPNMRRPSAGRKSRPLRDRSASLGEATPKSRTPARQADTPIRRTNAPGSRRSLKAMGDDENTFESIYEISPPRSNSGKPASYEYKTTSPHDGAIRKTRMPRDKRRDPVTEDRASLTQHSRWDYDTKYGSMKRPAANMSRSMELDSPREYSDDKSVTSEPHWL